MKTLIIAALIVAFASCTTGSGNRTITNLKPDSLIWRGRVLENNTIVPVKIPAKLITAYKMGDSVWVDMRNYSINDTSNTSMMVRLETKQ